MEAAETASERCPTLVEKIERKTAKLLVMTFAYLFYSLLFFGTGN
jgi:hypothetical protein